MTSATLTRGNIEAVRAHSAEAAFQAELSRDPSLTALRILTNDVRDFGRIRPEAWYYFDQQEMTGAAESLRTKHITETIGYYDAETDEIVASVAGGERVTYEQVVTNGYERSAKRALEDKDYAFQARRDAIFANNYLGPVKNMWREDPGYDTVIYGSAFADELLRQGEKGAAMLKELTYDTEDLKGFIYIFRRRPDNNMDFGAARLANMTHQPFIRFLKAHGYTDADFAKAQSHDLGSFVITANTTDQPLREVASEKAAMLDAALQMETGQRHFFGEKKPSIDAYEFFSYIPRVWAGYRQFHRLLAEHFAGQPLHDELRDYLTQLHVTQADHVLDYPETMRLGQQLMGDKITVDMALACKKLLTYAHYATIDALFEEFMLTGTITHLEGDDLRAYADSAGSSGGAAAAAGKEYGDCESRYGNASMNSAMSLAAAQGISIEEALRRLSAEGGPTMCFCPFCKDIVWVADICAREVKCPNYNCGALMVEGKVKYKGKKQEAAEKPARGPKKSSQAVMIPAQRTVGQERAVAGRKMVYQKWVTFAGVTYGWTDSQTGLRLPDDPKQNYN